MESGNSSDAQSALQQDLLQLQLQVAKKEADAAASRYALIRNVLIAAFCMAVGFALLIGLYLSKAIVLPLASAVNVAKQIAACNLTADIQVKSKDETGELMHALNVMKLSLANIVSGVRRNAEAIASSIEHGTVNGYRKKTTQIAPATSSTWWMMRGALLSRAELPWIRSSRP